MLDVGRWTSDVLFAGRGRRPVVRASSSRRCLVGVLALALAACQSSEEGAPGKAVESARSSQVKLTGAGIDLGEASAPPFEPGAFLARVEEHRAAGRAGTARRGVSRHPDVALEALRQATAATGALRLVAAVQDQRSRARPDESWAALVETLSEVGAFLEARAGTDRLLAEGRFAEAAEVDLVAAVPPGASRRLAVDAARRHGIALLLADRAEEAAAKLSLAAATAREAGFDEAFGLAVLASEAERRAGRLEAATLRWTEAVSLATSSVRQGHPIDPTSWDQAVYVRPRAAVWPARVAPTLGPLVERALGGPLAGEEAIVHAAIGLARLERGEPQAGLLELKKADALVADAGARARLGLAQATALARMGNESAARGLAAGLAQGPDAGVRRGATALLGALSLRRDQPELGLSLLARAVEDSPEGSWPGVAQAEADLGLAYLLAGNEEAGLRWLHAAQARMEREGLEDLLAQALANEIRYFETVGQADRAVEARARLESLESIG